MKARLVLLVTAADRAPSPSPAAAATTAARGSDPASAGAAEVAALHRSDDAARRRAEDERRSAGREHRRRRRPRRPDRLRARKLGRLDSGEELDYEKEVEPWLGEKGGLFFAGVRRRGLQRLRRRDPDHRRRRHPGIHRQAGRLGATSRPRTAPTKAIDYKVESDDGTAVGVVGDFARRSPKTKPTFKAHGRRLRRRIAGRRGQLRERRSPPRAGGSFADVFVDVGGLIEQSGGTIDPEAQQFLDSAGIDPEEATAVASLIPGSDQIEIDFSHRPRRRESAHRRRLRSCSARSPPTPSPPSPPPISASASRKRSTASTPRASPARSRRTSSRAP